MRVAHRRKRSVLFGARLPHRAAPGRFADSYVNKRPNVTFLFA